MQLKVKTDNARLKRSKRTPNFPLGGLIKPYGLYPTMIAPVLPGETMNSFSSKQVVISQPLANPFTGGWFESWLVYVKLTDIDRDLGQQFLNDDMSTSGYLASADNDRFFTADGQVDWIKLCYDKVVSDFFTDEGDTVPTNDGVAMLQLNNRSWYNNLMFEPTDVAVDTSDARQTYEALTGFAMLQQMQMTELTYEDYLETYGVKPSADIAGQSEILRFFRKWQRPTNIVNPADGTPSSAFVFNDEIKMDKAKRFTEPGFVIQLMAMRPKMYQGAIRSRSMAGELWGFNDWFPSYTLEDPTAGVKELSTAARDRLFDAAYRDTTTKNLIYDHRDILSHGEQFINATNAELPYPLPMATGMEVKDASDSMQTQGKYPTATDIENLFSGSLGTEQVAMYEGMASAVITGHIKDTIV